MRVTVESNPMQTWLKQYKVPKGAKYNFTSFAKPFGAYFIPEDSIQNFYDLYVTLIDENKVMPFMTEKPGDFGPVVSDIDLRYALEVETRQHDFAMIKTLVSSYFKNFKKYLNTTEDQLQCFVFEREEPYQTEKETKDGWHLMFPYLRPHAAVKHLVRLDVIEECREILATLKTMNSVEDIVDVAVISRNNWFMFGSGKPNLATYQLTHVLDEKIQEIKHDFSLKELVWLLRVNRADRNDEYVGDMSDEKVESLYKKRVALEKATKRKDSKSRKEIIPRETGHAESSTSQRVPCEVSFDLLEKSVMSLGTHRASGLEPGWIEVIWAIKNVCESNGYCEKWRELAHKWSETGGRSYAADAVDQKLDRIRDRCAGETKVMIGSIKGWLRQDNPIKFDELFPAETLSGKLKKSVMQQGAIFPIAEAVAEIYRDRFKCVDTKSMSFYEFRDHRWQATDSSALSILLSREVYMKYVKLSSLYGQDAANAQEDGKRNQLERQRQIASKIAQDLLDTRFKRMLCAEVGGLLYDKDMVSRLDSRVDLLGFTNGVYELLSGTFREGLPEDMLTFSCGYEFALEDDMAVQQDIFDCIRDIFAERDTAMYMVDILAACCYGHRRFEEVYLWMGSRGSNGKSMCADLMKGSLGQYAQTIDISNFTTLKKNANEASPALANTKGVRFVVSTEPEASEKLQSSKIKIISGGDEIEARRLYGASFSFKPQFGLFILMNDKLQMSKIDGGVQRRLRAVPFNYQFVDNPVEDHHKLIRRELKEKLIPSVSWRQQFMRVLLRHLKERVLPSQTLQMSSEVQAASSDYINDNNPVGMWLWQRYTRKDDKKAKVRVRDLLGEYQIDTGDKMMSDAGFSQALAYNNVRVSKAGVMYAREIEEKDNVEASDDDGA